VKVVALDTARDVGKAINPDAVVGQLHDGSAQGMGLALMEEIVVTDGHVRNPSFTDYLIPTILDMGEPPTISSGPAVAAAIRAATGKPLRRVPIRPEHITGT
jgi:CO/xanthine dehydrogenase Mo-binding subunit